MITEFYFKTQYAIVSYSLVGYSLQVLHTLTKIKSLERKTWTMFFEFLKWHHLTPFPSIPSG